MKRRMSSMLLLVISLSYFSCFNAYADEKSNQTILVTGGAGYIGSHTCVHLLE